jgi:hypothetical protein
VIPAIYGLVKERGLRPDKLNVSQRAEPATP